MAIFRVAPHPAVVKLWDESRDLASQWNEIIPPSKVVLRHAMLAFICYK